MGVSMRIRGSTFGRVGRSTEARHLGLRGKWQSTANQAYSNRASLITMPAPGVSTCLLNFDSFVISWPRLPSRSTGAWGQLEGVLEKRVALRTGTSSTGPNPLIATWSVRILRGATTRHLHWQKRWKPLLLVSCTHFI